MYFWKEDHRDKIHSYYIISRLHTINMTYHLMLTVIISLEIVFVRFTAIKLFFFSLFPYSVLWNMSLFLLWHWKGFVSSPSFIYVIMSLCQYGLTYIFLVLIQPLLLCFFVILFLNTFFFTFWHYRMLQAHLVYFLP